MQLSVLGIKPDEQAVQPGEQWVHLNFLMCINILVFLCPL